MLGLEKGTYLGEVLDISQSDGVIAGVTTYSEGNRTNLMHYHENSHLSFVLEGGMVDKRKNSEAERLPGELLFFHAGEPHRSINKVFPAKNINLEIESNFFTENAITESVIITSIKRNPNAKFIMLKIYKELLIADDFSDASIKMLLLNLIKQTNTAKNTYPDWITIIYELLNDKWNEELTLKDLSRAANVHAVTISKHFPKYFSCTLGEYRRRLKIEKSLRLIKTSTLSLTEIAYECGFFDQSHFTRTFKELTGFLPRHYETM
jgi:AraC family transcriptional regulator